MALLFQLGGCFHAHFPQSKVSKLFYSAEIETKPTATLTKDLPPIPDPTADPSDDVFRKIRKEWPVERVHYLRDSGIIRWIQDALIYVGLPALIYSFPDILRKMVRYSGIKSDCEFRTEPYGSHPRQLVDLISTTSSSKDLVVFAHGGAWGSGEPWMYRTCADSFIDSNYTVAVWGYRTYPDGDVPGQIEDLKDCVRYLKGKNLWDSVSIVGHSSGGHIATMAALQEEDLCDSLISISGVYDIPNHYQWESSRGVEEISALKPACGDTEENWIKLSPTRVLLEGNTAKLPRTLILHGAIDTTVPYTTALNFTEAALLTGQAIDLEVFPTVGHSDTCLQLIMGGETRDCVVEWLSGTQR